MGPARDLLTGRALGRARASPRRPCSSASTSRPARSSSRASSRASATRSRETGLEPTNLVLEITETALLKATPATIATLAELRALGVRTVIDDFGTGYFSLSHLRQFPIDILKIAGEFVQDADADPKSPALARAIVAMGRSMNMATVAEGIETAEQAASMRALGCTYGQGYFFSFPLSDVDVVAAFAREQERAAAAPPGRPIRKTRRAHPRLRVTPPAPAT